MRGGLVPRGVLYKYPPSPKRYEARPNMQCPEASCSHILNLANLLDLFMSSSAPDLFGINHIQPDMHVNGSPFSFLWNTLPRADIYLSQISLCRPASAGIVVALSNAMDLTCTPFLSMSQDHPGGTPTSPTNDGRHVEGLSSLQSSDSSPVSQYTIYTLREKWAIVSMVSFAALSG